MTRQNDCCPRCPSDELEVMSVPVFGKDDVYHREKSHRHSIQRRCRRLLPVDLVVTSFSCSCFCCWKRMALMSSFINATRILSKLNKTSLATNRVIQPSSLVKSLYYGCQEIEGKSCRSLHTTSMNQTFTRKGREEDVWPKPRGWPLKNEVLYPPQEEGEAVRRAEYFHYRANIKYSPKKMWYICCLIRGVSIDEAIKQLSFVNKKGAVIMKEVLEEAREIALKEHNFEQRSNMFVGACHAVKGLVVKGFRKHARFRMGIVNYFHCHVLVQLVEGPPPEDYYGTKISNRAKLDKYIDDLRRRQVRYTL